MVAVTFMRLDYANLPKSVEMQPAVFLQVAALHHSQHPVATTSAGSSPYHGEALEYFGKVE